jgi:hypothetical protein
MLGGTSILLVNTRWNIKNVSSHEIFYTRFALRSPLKSFPLSLSIPLSLLVSPKSRISTVGKFDNSKFDKSIATMALFDRDLTQYSRTKGHNKLLPDRLIWI